MQNNQLSFLKYGMLLLNIVTCMAVAILIYLTSWSVCSFNIAREFIETAQKIPSNPQQMVWIIIALLAVLVVSFVLRETYAERDFWGPITISIDLVVSIALILALNFNYNGLVLWVFSNALFFIKPIKGQYLIMMVAVFGFLGTDYKLISIRLNLFSIQDYIAFYEADIQQALLLGYNLAISVNMVLFILICVCVIQKQQGRIEEVNMLYQRLSLANEELKTANARMKKYAAMQEKMGETKERNRLAREIHDTLGHTLTGLSAGIDACIAMIDSSKGATKQHLVQLAEVSRMGLQDIRRSVSQLRPDALEGFKLEDAVQQMVTRVNATTNTTIRLLWNVKQSDFDEDEEHAVYRVIQESITNAIRHGHATHVCVTAEKKDGAMFVTIHDNGTGCTNIEKGFGLHHMEERIAMLNGQVTFQSEDGFTVIARIPIRWGRSNLK